MIKLDNHRKLKPNETIREGDFYKSMATGEVGPVCNSVGRAPSDNCYYDRFDFFRRLHTKKPAPVVTKKTKTVRNTTKRMPEVVFKYPSTKRWGAPATRTVKVISMDHHYITGLELEGEKYQFKRFICSKVIGSVELIGY